MLLVIDSFNLLLLLLFLVHIFHMYIFVCIELMSATKKTFTPEPALIEFKEMFDVKEWMTNVTPSIHDHLKAHQFKFVRIEDGGTRMFYKEWSTDDTWLPSRGLDLLEGAHQSRSIPIASVPSLVLPTFDANDLQKLTTTITKIDGYLEKSGAKEWWNSWLHQAEKLCSPGETHQSLTPQGNGVHVLHMYTSSLA